MIKRRGKKASTDSAIVDALSNKNNRGMKEITRMIPTGCTLVNLSLSDTPDGAFVPGSLVNIVGDSSSGKTFLGWSMFAEVVHDPFFDAYDLYFDEPERAFYMQAERLFGIKPGRIIMDIVSETIQDFKKNVLTVAKKGRPFIYMLDSFDALTSVEEQTRAAKSIDEDTDKEKGSYKTEKSRISGELFRMIMGTLEGTQSLLVVISQTRDKIGASFGEKKTRSGGHALRFYSVHELWLSVFSHEKVKNQEIGVNVLARTKKNKLTGKLRQVGFPIYYDYGVDDINACIDFLIEEEVWKMSGNKIITGHDVLKDTRRDILIKQIEENNLESVLKQLVAEAWENLEESLKLRRKPKYQITD